MLDEHSNNFAELFRFSPVWVNLQHSFLRGFEITAEKWSNAVSQTAMPPVEPEEAFDMLRGLPGIYAMPEESDTKKKQKTQSSASTPSQSTKKKAATNKS